MARAPGNDMPHSFRAEVDRIECSARSRCEASGPNRRYEDIDGLVMDARVFASAILFGTSVDARARRGFS